MRSFRDRSRGRTSWTTYVVRMVVTVVTLLALAATHATALTGQTSTYAGGGVGDGGPATNASLRSPGSISTDGAGNLYIADNLSLRVRRVSPAGVITTVAGVDRANGLATDATGNLYVAVGVLVLKASPAGTVTTVAGNGTGGFSGDGGPATSASLRFPTGLATDAAGNLYIADTGDNRIRKVDPAGTITTVAGNGTAGFSGDKGPATGASLNEPRGVATDASGNLYIADFGNNRVRRVASSGIITTVAGNGTSAFSGDGRQATKAGISPRAVATSAGDLYISDFHNARVRKVSRSGIITTVAGNGVFGYSGDGGPATSASLYMLSGGVATDGGGNLYIADLENKRVRRVSPAGIITTVAGNGESHFSGDGGPATNASLNVPSGVVTDAAGNVYVADTMNHRVRKVSPAGIISTVAGNGTAAFSGDGGPATSASLNSPDGVAADAAGNVYVADTLNNRVRRVSPAGVITTVAGNGTSGFAGDGGPATSASLNEPRGVVSDGSGNVYVADTGNNRVRRVSPAGVITTVAGNGAFGDSGDGGPATSASLNQPQGIATDAAGNLYIADTGNCRVRKVAATVGVITTVAGGDTCIFFGDGGPALNAALRFPEGVATDNAGNLYIADTQNGRVRRVDPTGIITTLVLSGAKDVATDAVGSLYVADGSTVIKVV